MRVQVLCEPPLRSGFALAGVDAVTATPADAERSIDTLAASPDIGLLLVQESLLAALPGPRRRALEQQDLPIIIPFPGPSRPPGEDAATYIAEILQRAVGYRLRL